MSNTKQARFYNGMNKAAFPAVGSVPADKPVTAGHIIYIVEFYRAHLEDRTLPAADYHGLENRVQRFADRFDNLIRITSANMEITRNAPGEFDTTAANMEIATLSAADCEANPDRALGNFWSIFKYGLWDAAMSYREKTIAAANEDQRRAYDFIGFSLLQLRADIDKVENELFGARLERGRRFPGLYGKLHEGERPQSVYIIHGFALDAIYLEAKHEQTGDLRMISVCQIPHDLPLIVDKTAADLAYEFKVDIIQSKA